MKRQKKMRRETKKKQMLDDYNEKWNNHRATKYKQVSQIGSGTTTMRSNKMKKMLNELKATTKETHGRACLVE